MSKLWLRTQDLSRGIFGHVFPSVFWNISKHKHFFYIPTGIFGFVVKNYIEIGRLENIFKRFGRFFRWKFAKIVIFLPFLCRSSPTYLQKLTDTRVESTLFHLIFPGQSKSGHKTCIGSDLVAYVAQFIVRNGQKVAFSRVMQPKKSIFFLFRNI